MASKPNPRPRPRPRPVASSSNTNRSPSMTPAPEGQEGSPNQASSSKQGQSAAYTTAGSTAEDDEDAMFFKNRNRSRSTWKMMNRKVKVQTNVSSDEEPSRRVPGQSLNLPEFKSPSPRNRARFKPKEKSLPSWTKVGGRARIDSSSEDEVKIIDSSEATPKGKSSFRTPKSKRKRSPSPALTPPPPVPIQQLVQARNIIQQNLGFLHRASSPPPTEVPDKDSFNEDQLPPELAKILAEVRSGSIEPQTPRKGRSADDAVVKIRVRWVPHPKDPLALDQTWDSDIKRSGHFRDLFEEIADETGNLSKNMVFTYKGARIFPSSTPHSLNIWSQAEIDACMVNTYEYIQRRKQHRALTPEDDEVISAGGRGRTGGGVNQAEGTWRGNADGDDDGASAFSQSGAESQSDSQSQSQKDTFKITIRAGVKDKASGSANVQSLIVKVRPSTKCGKIVETFLKRTGRPAGLLKKARIEIDGERMDPNVAIGESELEDGDVVDLVGL